MIRASILAAVLMIAAPAAAQGTYGQQTWSSVTTPQAPRSPSGPKTPGSPGFKPYQGVSTYERPANRAPYQYGPKPSSPATGVFGPDAGRKPKPRF